MKRILTAVLFSAIICGAVSCKKKDDTQPATAITPIMTIPNAGAPIAASLMTENTVSDELGMKVYNTWGILLSSSLECRMNDTSDNIDYHLDTWQEAYFCGADGTGFAYPGSVSINNVFISARGNGYYSQGIWRTDQLNHWEAAPAGHIPEVSANIMGSNPFYQGTIPTEVTLAKGLTFTFDHSKVINADSGYVLIHNAGKIARSNIVNLKTNTGGTATIQPDQLSGMQNEYFSFDGRTFYGAVIEVVLVNDTTETFEDKPFTFAAQFEFARRITFK
jgi:hypothetical protein